MPDSSTSKDFTRIAASGNALNWLSQHLAPNIVGLEYHKKILCLALGSTDDEGSSRGRIHVLIWGSPGTAKTSVVTAAAAEAEAVVYGPRASVGGITIDFRSGQIGVIGGVHESEFQILALDELEKFDSQTLEHLLQAMENARIPYAGGGTKGVIPAHIRLIAACNDRRKLPIELLDRFDYQLHVPYPTKQQAHQIVEGIADSYKEPAHSPPPGIVRNYLQQARKYKPDFPQEERRIAKNVFKILIDSERKNEVHLRRYHAVLRTAYALARIDQAPVTAERLMDAATLLYPDWNAERLRSLRELLTLRKDRPYARTLIR